MFARGLRVLARLAVAAGLLLAGCPRPEPPTGLLTSTPATATPASRPTNPLARAHALLTPYDPGGSSRDAVELLLGLAKSGNRDAYALLARTYVDWTAYAAFAGDVPLLVLIERDLGVDVGLGAAPFPLPAVYVDRLSTLARKGGVEKELGALLRAWKNHDLSPAYWSAVAAAIEAGSTAAALWALMDCDEALRAARRVPAGLAPWILARGCAVAAPAELPRLMDSGPAERDSLSFAAAARIVGCDPVNTECAESDFRYPVRGAASFAVYTALVGRARALRSVEGAAGPLVAFAREALAPVAARRAELALPLAHAPMRATPELDAGTTTHPVAEVPASSAALWLDEGPLIVVLLPGAPRATADSSEDVEPRVSIASKPVLSVSDERRPIFDLGPSTKRYPGDEVTIASLGATLSAHFAAWETRGFGGALGPAFAGAALGPGAVAGGRSLTLAIDPKISVARVAAVLDAAAVARVEAFHVLAAGARFRATEVPTRFALGGTPRAAPPAPGTPSLELRVDAKRVTLTPKGLGGAKAVAIRHRDGAPDTPAIYAAALRLLPVAEKARAALRVTAARGVRFGHLWDALDAIRYEVPGGPFATRDAFDAARFASGADSAASLPVAVTRRELSGPFTVVLDP